MLSQVLFEIPQKFISGVASGEIIQFGAILKSAATGQIVGHLQETGIAQSLISQALSTGASSISPYMLAVNAVSKVVDTGVNVYSAYQIHQLKSMVETLQALQVATLGASLVGVGVSVAGFLYMRKRFNTLDGRLDKIIDVVREGFANVEKSAFRQQMSRTKSLVQRAELAKSSIDPAREYREIAAHLADQAAFFEGEILFQFSVKGPIGHDKMWLLAQLWMLCNSVRLDCQIRANDLLNAQHVAERIAGEYQDLFDRVGPASFDVDHKKGGAIVKVLRDATDSAHSKPFLLDYMRTRRIDGAEYIGRLDSEKEQAMLVLAVR